MDATHSNIAAVWRAIGGSPAGPAGDGGRAWPAEDQWSHLLAHDRLDEFAPVQRLRGGTVVLEFPLPMPGISCLEFTRVSAPADT